MPGNKPSPASNTQEPVTCPGAARRPQTSTRQGASQVRTKGQRPPHAPRLRGRRIDRPPAGNSAKGPQEEGRGKGTTLLTGWPWGPASSVSHSGAERWLSPSVQGATLPRQPKEQRGKRPTTAKTRALLTGRSPSTTPAWSPKAPATLNSNVTVSLLTGRCFAQSASLFPPRICRLPLPLLPRSCLPVAHAASPFFGSRS